MVLGNSPLCLDPTAVLEAQERRIECSLIEVECTFGDLLDPLGEAKSVLGPHGLEGSQDHQVQSALQNLGLVLSFRHAKGVYSLFLWDVKRKCEPEHTPQPFLAHVPAPSQLRRGCATHCNTHLGSQFADSIVAELPEAAARFEQTLLPNYRDVFRTSCRVRLQTSLARRQKYMRGGALVDARGQGHDHYGIGPFVTISGVERDDHHWPSPFPGWIDVELDKPNLAAERKSIRRRHSGALLREFAQRELTPIGLLF